MKNEMTPERIKILKDGHELIKSSWSEPLELEVIDIRNYIRKKYGEEITSNEIDDAMLVEYEYLMSSFRRQQKLEHLQTLLKNKNI